MTDDTAADPPTTPEPEAPRFQQAKDEYWIVSWVWRHPNGTWRLENTRVAGCLGMWWAQHVQQFAGAREFRLLSGVQTCAPAYEALAQIMPAAVDQEGELG